MSGMLGIGEVSADETANKMRDTLEIVRKINAQFQNPVSDCFLFVVINFFVFANHVKIASCSSRYLQCFLSGVFRTAISICVFLRQG